MSLGLAIRSYMLRTVEVVRPPYAHESQTVDVESGPKSLECDCGVTPLSQVQAP